MNKPSFNGRLLLATAGVIFGVSDAAAAPPACSLATLSGHYGFLFQGPTVTLGAATVQAYTASTGVLVVDGHGNFTVTRTDNVNGVISTHSLTATYTVNPDCTGTAQNNGDGLTFSFVAGAIRDNVAQEVLFMTTSLGVVDTGIAKRLLQEH
jgi:hypothetical protein